MTEELGSMAEFTATVTELDGHSMDTVGVNNSDIPNLVWEETGPFTGTVAKLEYKPESL